MNLDLTTHIFLNNKGGIGKTLSASMFIQYFIAAGYLIEGVDSDQQAPKLSRIKALNVPLIPLFENGEIQQSSFDPVFTHILQSKNATLIDVGSSAFLPILKYMSDNRLYGLLNQVNKQLFYHVIVTSGAEKYETVQGAEQILGRIKGTKAKAIIWQNEKDGIPTFGGKQIQETDWYIGNQDHISGIVKILDYNNTAFRADFLALMTEELTYQEIMDGKSKYFDFMRQNRINRIFMDVFSDLDAIFNARS